MSTDLPTEPPQPTEPDGLGPVAAIEPVDLAGPDDGVGDGRPVGPSSRWRHQALVIGLVVLLLGGVAVALLASNKGEPSAEAALAEVRAFVAEQRTATFTGVSEDTMTPKDGDVGTSETTRSRMKGELRLPDQLHLVVDEGDWADETIIHGREVYSRSADSQGELAAEQWVKSTTEEEAWSGLSPAVDAEYMPGLEDAAGFMTMTAAGIPLDLTTLLDRLANPERLGPNRIRASVTYGELLPEGFREAMEKAAEHAALEEDEDLGPPPDEMFEQVLEVTIDYGPDGRLDVLSFDSEEDGEDELYRYHQEFRFSGWGAPVSLTLPTGDQIDPTPTVDEAGLAAAAAAGVTVLAPAPSALPPGWGLGSVEAEEADAEFETCAGASLTFVPENFVPEDADGEVPMPGLDVRSIRADCQWADEELFWPKSGDPDRTVRIGQWTAQVFAEDDADFFYGMGTLVEFTAGTTKVLVRTTLPDAQFIEILKTLRPFDLGAYKLVDNEGFDF